MPGKNYVYGTAARKIEYDIYEENHVLKAKKENKSNSKAKLKVIFGLVVIFACSLLLMYRYALITELNYGISELDKTYNTMRNENSRLKVEIENNMSIAQIKEAAENKLGMQKPDRYQLVYIKTPRIDRTVVAADYKEVKKHGDSMFAILLDKVNKFVRLLD